MAHESSVWDNRERFQRDCRLLGQLSPGHCSRTALHVLDLIDDGVSDAHTARTERVLLDLPDDRDGLALLAYVAELHRPLTRSRRISTERVSRPDLVADVGVLGDQVQSSAGR